MLNYASNLDEHLSIKARYEIANYAREDPGELALETLPSYD